MAPAEIGNFPARSPKQLADSQFRWAALKALAGIVFAVAVISGTVIALENYLRPTNQQPMFPPGTIITIPAARN